MFLALGLVSLSQSANIIRIGDAGPVAISAWRLVLATVFLAPMAGKKLATLLKITKVEVGLLLLAGAALATHFFSWIFAVQHTTVANATLFLCINPVITASGAYLFFKERASKRLILAIVLGLAGVAVLGGNDLGYSPDHIVGDVAALVSSVLFTVYFLVAKRIRKFMDADVYVTAVYGIAALISCTVLVFEDAPFFDYDTRTWVCFLAMALFPTMIGHTSLNTALKYIDAGRISTYTLIEPVLAGLVATFAWNEEITGLVVVGYILICGSVLVVATERKPPLLVRRS